MKSMVFVIEPNSLTLAAYERRDVSIAGSYFVLISNSTSTPVQIGFNDGQVKSWPVLFSFSPKEDNFFTKVSFYNPTAAAMTVEYIISNGVIKNESAQIVGAVEVLDITDGITTPVPKIILPMDAWNFDAAAVVDKAPGLPGRVGFPFTAHPFINGESIVVNGTTNYDGTYTIVGVSANEIIVYATYVAEVFAAGCVCQPAVNRSIAANADRKEIIISNLDATHNLYVGGNPMPNQYDGAVLVAYAGIPVPPNMSIGLATTAEVFLQAAEGAGTTGIYISYAELEKS